MTFRFHDCFLCFVFMFRYPLRFVHLVSRQLHVHGSVYIRVWDKFLSSPSRTWGKLVVTLLPLHISRPSPMDAT